MGDGIAYVTLQSHMKWSETYEMVWDIQNGPRHTKWSETYQMDLDV